MIIHLIFGVVLFYQVRERRWLRVLLALAFYCAGLSGLPENKASAATLIQIAKFFMGLFYLGGIYWIGNKVYKRAIPGAKTE